MSTKKKIVKKQVAEKSTPKRGRGAKQIPEGITETKVEFLGKMVSAYEVEHAGEKVATVGTLAEARRALRIASGEFGGSGRGRPMSDEKRMERNQAWFGPWLDRLDKMVSARLGSPAKSCGIEDCLGVLNNAINDVHNLYRQDAGDENDPDVEDQDDATEDEEGTEEENFLEL